MKFGWLGALLALTLLVTGWSRLRESFAYPKVQVASLAEFLRAPKREGWIKLTDVRLRPSNLVYVASARKEAIEREQTGGRDAFDIVTSVYLPAIAAGGTAGGLAKLLVRRYDPPLLELVNRMDDGDEAALQKLAVLGDVGPLTVEGMVQGPEEIGTAEKLKEFNVAADALVIHQGQTPRHWSIGVIMLLGAATIFGSILFSLYGWVRAR